MSSCRICGKRGEHRTTLAKEMMFGRRDPFRYFECAACGCVQIEEIPSDLSKYYPNEYYSLQEKKVMEENVFRAFLRRRRARYCLYGRGFFGRILAGILGVPDYYEWLKKGGVDFDSRILDAGCGSGNLLLYLAREGFRRLEGADPFIEKELLYDNGVRIYKKGLAQMEGRYDFVMMHHSFEHMAGPAAELGEISRLLIPGRTALIRVPVAGSFAWKEYGADWVQLDPPRHLYLHTEKSMAHLAQQAGLEIVDIVYDSIAFQFWGSEQYRKGMPLTDPKSHFLHPENSTFTREEIAAYESHARELNKSGEGDQACFYLRKPA